MAGEPINPYAPPASAVDRPPSDLAAGAFDRPLFSARQIGVASFFGSLAAGVFMLHLNFRVMKQPSAANKTLALGLLSARRCSPCWSWHREVSRRR